MTIAENIKKYRQALGLTQTQLAEKLGTTQKVITNYERGLNNPLATKMPEIAKALEVTLDQLYGLEKNGKVKQKPLKSKNKRVTKINDIFEELPPSSQRAVIQHAEGLSLRKKKPGSI